MKSRGCRNGGAWTAYRSGTNTHGRPGPAVARHDGLPARGHRPCARQPCQCATQQYAMGVLRPWPDRRGGSTQALDGTTILDTIAQSHRYHSRIFLAPPWPEIYVQDEERRHSMDEARAEFERLQRTYPALGYAVSRLPKIRVAHRADFVLDPLASR